MSDGMCLSARVWSRAPRSARRAEERRRDRESREAEHRRARAEAAAAASAEEDADPPPGFARGRFAAMSNADEFGMPLQELVAQYCWGDVWNRRGLDRKTRSIINLAMIHNPHLIVYAMLAISLAGASWMIIASSFGLPASITNAIVGALVGFGWSVNVGSSTDPG